MYVFWIAVIVTTSFNALFHAEINLIASQLLTVVMVYAASYIWFVEDAKVLGQKPSKALVVGVVTGASICIPYYLLRYKGFKRSVLSVSKFSVLFVVSASILGAMPL